MPAFLPHKTPERGARARRLGLALLCIVWPALALSAQAAHAQAVRETSYNLAPWIGYYGYVDPAIPVRMSVTIANLSSSELSVRASTVAERGTRTSAFATAIGAYVAINGDLFSPGRLEPAGLAMGNGMLWSETADDAVSGFLHVRRDELRSHAGISRPQDVVEASTLPPGTTEIVSGRPLVMAGGQPITEFDCTDPLVIPCERAPRTAVAVSADGIWLILVVVDGWQSASAGMTAAELAAFLPVMGADLGIAVGDALMLDSGSAATMFARSTDGLLNRLVSVPSDGAERTVANHLAVVYQPKDPGTLTGIVTAANPNGAPPELANVSITLDVSQTANAVTDATGAFSVPGLTPRFTCVTATLEGWQSSVACAQVPPAGTANLPILMYRLGEPVPGAGSDGGVPSDGGVSPDGGSGTGGASDGSCRAAGGSTGLLSTAVLVLLALALSGTRRRS